MAFWRWRLDQGSGSVLGVRERSGFCLPDAKVGEGASEWRRHLLQVRTGRDLAEAFGGMHEPTSPGVLHAVVDWGLPALHASVLWIVHSLDAHSEATTTTGVYPKRAHFFLCHLLLSEENCAHGCDTSSSRSQRSWPRSPTTQPHEDR